MMLTTGQTSIQCGAAIYQLLPNSSLFKLPALAHPDVQNWMRSTFPAELTLLRAAAGSPIDLQRIQDEVMRRAIADMHSVMTSHSNQLLKLAAQVDRRTAVFSPTRGGFSTEVHYKRRELALIP